MTTERWQRVEALFGEAAQHGHEDRAAWLDLACGGDSALRAEVEALLRADERARSGEFITQMIADAAEDLTAAAESQRLGERVGNYRVVGELGHGGMGTVYLAERDDAQYRATVAVKFVRGARSGPAALRRLRAERQILAGLTHPNIARLLDGGTAEDGTPYLVLEHVDGEPIDLYCERRSLDVRDRLRLFRRVCDGVQDAHRHLVVHRDIKPSNILVTADGTPKLLDFGVAKLLDPTGDDTPDTATAAQLLTPAYASPEQVRGDPITTATDIYSLGVLLYRLLTGRLPYREGPHRGHQLARAILEEEPEPPSRAWSTGGPPGDSRRMRKVLRGDIDAIVLTALEKPPARRYPSVEQFSDDVQRVLVGLPVRARPATRAYRLRKFVNRHRIGVLATAATVAILVGLTTFYTVGLARQRDFAEQEQRKAEQVAAFMERLFLVSDPTEARGQTITAREVLDSAVARVPTALDAQPQLQAAMLYTLGGVYNNLGLYREARPLLEQGLELRRLAPGSGTPTVGDFLYRLGNVLLSLGAFDSSATLLHDAAARLGTEYDTPDRVVYALSLQAGALRRAGRLAEADTILTGALAQARQLQLDSVLNDLLLARGALLLAQRRGADGEPVLREAWQRLRDRVGEDAPVTITALSNLGQALYQQTRFADAEPVIREALSLQRRVNGEDHPTTATAWNNLAALLQAQGRPVEAEEAARQALAIYRASFGERHQRVALSMTNLASMLLAQGKLAEAERLHREALAIKQEILRPGHIDIAGSYNNLAHVLEDGQRYAEAERMYRAAVNEINQGVGVESLEGAIFLFNLGRVLDLRDRRAEAERTMRRALAIQRERLPAHHASTATTLAGLGSLLTRTARATEAEPLLVEALEIRNSLLPSDHWAIQVTRSLLGECAAALGRTGEAESLLTTSALALQEKWSARDSRTRAAIDRVVRFYLGQGNQDRADAFRARLQ